MAIDTMLAVCQDPKAQASARATCSVGLLRAAGYLGKKADEDDAEGASLYCSLEPCCHHGRTPPCTDALIAAGIKRAVIATADPDSRVNGRGIELIRAAGIDVEVGLLAREAERLNEAYNKFVTYHVLLLTPDSAEPKDLIRDRNLFETASRRTLV